MHIHWLQTEAQIVEEKRYIESANEFMYRLLDHCSLLSRLPEDGAS